MRFNRALAEVLSIILLLQGCGQDGLSTANLKTIASYNVNGRTSSDGVPLESKLFLSMNYQSDKVKMLVGENLQYHFQSQALIEYLNRSLDEALKKSDPKNSLPDVFSFIAKPLRSPETSNLAINEFESIEKINALNQEKMQSFKNARLATETLSDTASLIPVYGTFAGKIIQKSSDIYYEGKIQAQTDLTNKMTAEFLKDTINLEDKDKLSNLNPENFNYLNDKYDLINKANNIGCASECTADQKQLFQQSVIHELTRLGKANVSDFGQIQAALDTQSESTKKLQTDFINLKKDLARIDDVIIGKIEELAIAQNDLNAQVTNLSEQINTVREDLSGVKDDVRFMKDFMFSKMSVNEKLAALQSGSYGQSLLKEKKDLLEKQLIFQSKLQGVADTISNINGILNNLGINNPILNKAAKYSAVAAGLANNLLSMKPDYLSAALMITSLFGSKKDVAAERHAEVMNKLGVMDQKLDVIIQNQMEMMKLQMNTMQMINIVSQKLDVVEDKVDSVLLGIKINRQGISELLNRPLDNCNQFLNNLDKDLKERVGYDEFTNSHMTPYMVRLDHFDSFKKQFENCDDITNQLSLISTQGKISQSLLMSFDGSLDDTREGQVDSVKSEYLKTIYPNNFNLFAKVVNAAKDQKERTALLRKYVVLGIGEYKSPKELLARYNFIFNDSKGQKIVDETFEHSSFKVLREMEGDLLKALENPISKPAVYKVSDILNKMFYYFDIVKNGNLLSLKELIGSTGRGVNSKGYLALRDLNTIQTLAQVQSNIENGYLTFPYLFNNLDKGAVVKEAVGIMLKNKNFEKHFKNFYLINQAYNSSKTDLYRHYENVGKITRALPADILDSRSQKAAEEDAREMSLDMINNTFNFNKQGRSTIEWRKDKVSLVIKYKDELENDSTKQQKEHVIPVGKFKVSAEELWTRDYNYEAMLRVGFETYSNMMSYDFQLSLYNKYKNDKKVLFDYTKLILQTPINGF